MYVWVGGPAITLAKHTQLILLIILYIIIVFPFSYQGVITTADGTAQQILNYTQYVDTGGIYTIVVREEVTTGSTAVIAY